MTPPTAPTTSSTAQGEVAYFDETWHYTLQHNATRFLIYPERDSNQHTHLFEWIKAQQVLRLLHTHDITGGRTLEYGCGAAGISLFLAQHGYATHLSDLSRAALAVADMTRAHAAAPHNHRSQTVADAMRMPYADGSFDAVMSYGLLEHFTPAELDRLLSESVRVLRPGGLFIADIVPGLRSLNVRTLGTLVGYAGSVAAHALTLRWGALGTLHDAYFEPFFESTYSDREWVALLQHHPLTQVRVDVCRPFPPLPLSGAAEAAYTRLIRASLPLHHRFDAANNWFTRRWGWMYLASGIRAT